MIVKSNIRDTIIANYDQVELFAKYLKIDRSNIDYCLKDKSYKISNPLRNDENPSMGFMYVGNKLYYKDWAIDEYSGDIDADILKAQQKIDAIKTDMKL